jgi:hypothetical protein
MPLEKGKSRATVGKNISEMVKAGHPQDQAVAASLREARQSGKRSAGRRGDRRAKRR